MSTKLLLGLLLGLSFAVFENKAHAATILIRSNPWAILQPGSIVIAEETFATENNRIIPIGTTLEVVDVTPPVEDPKAKVALRDISLKIKNSPIEPFTIGCNTYHAKNQVYCDIKYSSFEIK